MIPTTQEWKIGDCVELMQEMNDDCIDLVITSPPYDNLRTYGGERNFRFEDTAHELYRVVKPGGVVVWVVGDQTINGSETGTSFRQALHFKNIGFNLHDTMIYSKGAQGGAPGSSYAYLSSFEYMFILSKGIPHTHNLIKDRPNIKYNKGSVIKSSLRESDDSRHSFKCRIERFGKRTNVWEIHGGYRVGSTDKISFLHPATFPEQLAKDHIISWSNEGDLVLDPLCGSGTVLKMCRMLNRNGIGFEINPDYEPLIRERSMANTPTLQSYFGETE